MSAMLVAAAPLVGPLLAAKTLSEFLDPTALGYPDKAIFLQAVAEFAE